jgi:glycosyltransferase involved in cell wall biosynthesis
VFSVSASGRVKSGSRRVWVDYLGSMYEHDDITLVVPTYNRADALRANLGPMLQMAEIAEVIVVDDGSADDTVAVCEQFNDKRLRVISHSSNQGVTSARNTGVAAAKGGWILSGDDNPRLLGQMST